MNRLNLLFVFIAMVALTSCEKSDTDSEILTIEDVLTQDNEITGWSYSGSGWTASSITELSEYINGMAETYNQYGFEEAAQQSYSGTLNNASSTLSVIIYDMGSEENAKDMYDDPDLGLSSAIDWTDGAGTEAHYALYGGLSEVITFYQGSFFVYQLIDYDSDETLSIMKQFALNISGKLEDYAGDDEDVVEDEDEDE